jgi:transposase
MSMSKKQYPVYLSVEERNMLRAIVSKGTAPEITMRRAQILLLSDEHRSGGNKTFVEIADELQIHVNTVLNIRKTFARQGLQEVIQRKKRTKPPVPPKVTNELEAQIVALSRSEPPSGKSRWSLRLLANKAIELEYIDSISYDTVDRILKKRGTAAAQKRSYP